MPWPRRPPAPGWRSSFLIGVVIGGALSGLLGGTRGVGFGYGSFDDLVSRSLGMKAAVLASAGALMGYGARMGGGCTSGHGLCGVALGSRASAVATAVFFAAAVATAHLLAGPAAAQLGRGQLAALFTVAGLLSGVLLRGMRDRHAARARRPVPTAAAPDAVGL